MKFGYNRPVVSVEKLFENVDGRTTYDRACLYYMLPRSLRLNQAKTDEFAYRTDPDEVVHNEPPHRDLHCLSFNL